MTVLMKIRELQGESQQDPWKIEEKGEGGEGGGAGGEGGVEWLAIIHQNRTRQTFLIRGDLSKVDIWETWFWTANYIDYIICVDIVS